jgi:hypothetical protein
VLLDFWLGNHRQHPTTSWWSKLSLHPAYCQSSSEFVLQVTEDGQIMNYTSTKKLDNFIMVKPTSIAILYQQCAHTWSF